ncbi:hypothetical protein D3C76_1396560 [compost metagenome]
MAGGVLQQQSSRRSDDTIYDTEKRCRNDVNYAQAAQYRVQHFVRSKIKGTTLEEYCYLVVKLNKQKQPASVEVGLLLSVLIVL